MRYVLDGWPETPPSEKKLCYTRALLYYISTATKETAAMGAAPTGTSQFRSPQSSTRTPINRGAAECTR